MQALWMLLGAFFFATMAVCVKVASAWFTSSELVFYRGVVSMGLVWLLARQLQVPLATRHPGVHVWRSVVGALYGLWLFGDDIPLGGWIGMALIVASGVVATVLQARISPMAPAPEQ